MAADGGEARRGALWFLEWGGEERTGKAAGGATVSLLGRIGFPVA